MPPRRSFEEEAMPEKFNLGVWLTIGKYALRRWKLVLFGLLCTLFVTFYDASFVPVMNAGAISSAELLASTPAGSLGEVAIPVTFIFGIHVDFTFLGYALTLGVAVLIRSILIIFTFYLNNLISMHIMTDLRRDSFRKIQELSFSYFDANSSGWLIARMQNDTSSLGDILSWSFNTVLWAIFQLVFAIATMFSVSWAYSLIVLASLPIVAIFTPFFEKAILVAHRKARNAYSRYVGYLAESIAGAKTIKTLGIENRVYVEAEEITEDVRKKRLHAGRLNAVYTPFLTLVSQIMVAVVLFVGLAWMKDAKFAVDAALIVLFVSFVSSIYDPLATVAEILTEFMGAQAGAEKVNQLLQEKVEIQDSPEVIELYGSIFHPKKETYVPMKGEIEYKDVRFHYATGPEVIHGINLKIPAGQSVAIVGETGSGKTTLANLLCRFYEPTSGSILVDGIDTKERSLGYLRTNIGYVQQTPFVFAGSFFDNIAYGKENATLEEAIEAAKQVGIHDFIISTKDGYDTILEDGGGMLSQGQKQLIAFARAILRNPSILILDEATSSIDTLTEATVQKAMYALLEGRTSIIIAHRLSTIVGCDRILFLDKGEIVEDGDHKALLEKKGSYYSLYMSQFQDLSIGEQMERYENDIVSKKIDFSSR